MNRFRGGAQRGGRGRMQPSHNPYYVRRSNRRQQQPPSAHVPHPRRQEYPSATVPHMPVTYPPIPQANSLIGQNMVVQPPVYLPPDPSMMNYNLQQMRCGPNCQAACVARCPASMQSSGNMQCRFDHPPPPPPLPPQHHQHIPRQRGRSGPSRMQTHHHVPPRRGQPERWMSMSPISRNPRRNMNTNMHLNGGRHNGMSQQPVETAVRPSVSPQPSTSAAARRLLEQQKKQWQQQDAQANFASVSSKSYEVGDVSVENHGNCQQQTTKAPSEEKQPQPPEDEEGNTVPKLNTKTGRMEGGAGICEEIKKIAHERFIQNQERMNALMDGKPMNLKPQVVTTKRHSSLSHQVKLLQDELDRQLDGVAQTEKECKERLDSYKQSKEKFSKEYMELSAKTVVTKQVYDDLVEKYYNEMKGKVNDSNGNPINDANATVESVPIKETDKPGPSSGQSEVGKEEHNTVEIKVEPPSPESEHGESANSIPNIGDESDREMGERVDEEVMRIFHSQDPNYNCVQDQEPSQQQEMQFYRPNLGNDRHIDMNFNIYEGAGDLMPASGQHQPQPFYIPEEPHPYVQPMDELNQHYEPNNYEMADPHSNYNPYEQDIGMDMHQQNEQYPTYCNLEEHYNNPHQFQQQQQHQFQHIPQMMQAPQEYNMGGPPPPMAPFQHGMYANSPDGYNNCFPQMAAPYEHPGTYNAPRQYPFHGVNQNMMMSPPVNHGFPAQNFPPQNFQHHQHPLVPCPPSNFAPPNFHHMHQHQSHARCVHPQEYMQPRFQPPAHHPIPQNMLMPPQASARGPPAEHHHFHPGYQCQVPPHWQGFSPEQILQAYPDLQRQLNHFESMRLNGIFQPPSQELQYFFNHMEHYRRSTVPAQPPRPRQRRGGFEDRERRKPQPKRVPQPSRKPQIVVSDQEPISPDIEVPLEFAGEQHHQAHNILLCGGGVFELKTPSVSEPPSVPDLGDAVTQELLRIIADDPNEETNDAFETAEIVQNDMIAEQQRNHNMNGEQNPGNFMEVSEAVEPVGQDRNESMQPQENQNQQAPMFQENVVRVPEISQPESAVAMIRDEPSPMSYEEESAALQEALPPPPQAQHSLTYSSTGTSKLALLLEAAEKAYESQQMEADDQDDDPDALVIDESVVINDVGIHGSFDDDEDSEPESEREDTTSGNKPKKQETTALLNTANEVEILDDPEDGDDEDEGNKIANRKHDQDYIEEKEESEEEKDGEKGRTAEEGESNEDESE